MLCREDFRNFSVFPNQLLNIISCWQSTRVDQIYEWKSHATKTLELYGNQKTTYANMISIMFLTFVFSLSQAWAMCRLLLSHVPSRSCTLLAMLSKKKKKKHWNV